MKLVPPHYPISTTQPPAVLGQHKHGVHIKFSKRKQHEDTCKILRRATIARLQTGPRHTFLLYLVGFDGSLVVPEVKGAVPQPHEGIF